MNNGLKLQENKSELNLKAYCMSLDLDDCVGELNLDHNDLPSLVAMGKKYHLNYYMDKDYRYRVKKVIDEINNYFSSIESGFFCDYNKEGIFLEISVVHLSKNQIEELTQRMKKISCLSGIDIHIDFLNRNPYDDELGLKLTDYIKVFDIITISRMLGINWYRDKKLWNLINSGLPEHNYRTWGRIIRIMRDILGEKYQNEEVKWDVNSFEYFYKDFIVEFANDTPVHLVERIKKRIHLELQMNGILSVEYREL